MYGPDNEQAFGDVCDILATKEQEAAQANQYGFDPEPDFNTDGWSERHRWAFILSLTVNSRIIDQQKIIKIADRMKEV